MNKMFKILEMVWLVLGAIGISMCVYFLIIGDRTGAIYFLVFTFISGVMYAVRKRQRKKVEEYNNSQKK